MEFVRIQGLQNFQRKGRGTPLSASQENYRSVTRC